MGTPPTALPPAPALARRRAVAVALALALSVAACSSGPGERVAEPDPRLPPLRVTSAALVEGQPIPAANACADDEHLGASPALSWSPGPEGTAGYAVTVTDPDASGFVHWAVAFVPKEVTSLAEGASGRAMPAGAHELANDFGKPGYGGPCPPRGKPHHYVFRVWAVKAPIDAVKADESFFASLAKGAIATGAVTVTHRR